MPKLKTKSGVKKRFKLTATGKVKHGVAGKRHRLISHNAKYIRQNRGTDVISDADAPDDQEVGALRAQLRSTER
jgi:large subunit ribosomal protein L35